MKVDAKGRVALEPTLTIRVNKETRQISVEVKNWEGVSPGMLQGIDYHVSVAVHKYHLLHSGPDIRADAERQKELLVKQAGTGEVFPQQQLDHALA